MYPLLASGTLQVFSLPHVQPSSLTESGAPETPWGRFSAMFLRSKSKESPRSLLDVGPLAKPGMTNVACITQVSTCSTWRFGKRSLGDSV